MGALVGGAARASPDTAYRRYQTQISANIRRRYQTQGPSSRGPSSRGPSSRGPSSRGPSSRHPYNARQARRGCRWIRGLESRLPDAACGGRLSPAQFCHLAVPGDCSFGGRLVRSHVLVNRIEVESVNSSNQTTITGTSYDTVSGNMWADVNASGQVQTRYLNGDATDQVIARIGSTGLTAWYLTDDQGSVGDLMNNSGSVQDHITYDAFGNILCESNPSYGDRIKYDGRELDSVLGLYYNRARMYDATTGRWMSQDPLGFAAGDSNLYRYVGNGPTNGTDPSGEVGNGNPPTDAEILQRLQEDDYIRQQEAIGAAAIEASANSQIHIKAIDKETGHEVIPPKRIEPEEPPEEQVVLFRPGVTTWLQKNGAYIDGGVRVIGGGLEAGAAVGLVPVCPPAAVLVGAMALDNLQTGARELYSGETKKSVVNQTIKAGLSQFMDDVPAQFVADLGEMGVQFAVPVAAEEMAISQFNRTSLEAAKLAELERIANLPIDQIPETASLSPGVDPIEVWENEGGGLSRSSQSVDAAESAAAKFATNPDEAVFWSGRTASAGGADVAGDIAASQGGTTLEQLAKARGIDLPVWDAGNPVSVQAWQDASRAFAGNAQGTVRAVIGDSLRPGNVWETVELPALKANPNVTQIIRINPATVLRLSSSPDKEAGPCKTKLTNLARQLYCSSASDRHHHHVENMPDLFRSSRYPKLLLESQVVSLLEEVGRIQVDWSAHSLESAGEMARTEMHTRHPDLSDTALRALAWKFTFDWR